MSEGMSVAPDTIAASSGEGVLFEHGDVQAVLCQVGGGGDAAQASADNQNRDRAHSFTPRFGADKLRPGASDSEAPSRVPTRSSPPVLGCVCG